MTDQRQLDRILGAFFADGQDELADRVIAAALDQIDHTRQRRVMRMPRRFQTMTPFTRVAAAAVIGVLAVGGTFLVVQRGQPSVAGPGTTAAATPTVTPAPTPAPTPTQEPTATPAPTLAILTGPLGVGRQIHTATSLSDGRVLVAGGFDAHDDALASAVIFDPATDTFSPTGSMAAPRGLATATLLADGRVLVAGGGYANWIPAKQSPLPAAGELYDPKTGTFSLTGSLSTPREDHTATRLTDGRVLITGGADASGSAVASAEVYDPKTGTFSPTGSMVHVRSFHTATLLADGRVLIAGGSPSGWNWNTPLQASAEIYDPKTGTFAPTGSMTTSRINHAATLLADGRVLVTGGTTNDGSTLAAAELFDPKTDTFTPITPMALARTYHSATLLADGRVLVAGGGGNYANLSFIASTEIFDPKTGTFSPTGPMAHARTYHAAALLPGGGVLVTGGFGAAGPLPNAETWDPGTGTFKPAG